MIIFLICLLIYISLGIPDGIIGSVWPVMSNDIGVDPGFLGFIGTISFTFSIISVMLYPKIVKKFNLSFVIAISIIFLIIGFSCYLLSYMNIFLIIGAIFIGIGGGGIDTGINEYAVKNFDARKINILHAFYAIGVSVGAFICSIVFMSGNSWEFSIVLVAFLLFLIFLVVIAFRRVFSIEHIDEIKTKGKVKGANIVFWFYFIYAVEIVTSMFISSYVFFELGLGKSLASFAVFMFWVGLFIGRLFAAFITKYLKGSKLLILCILVSLFSAVFLFVFNTPIFVCIFSFGIGFGFGPIYPTMLSEIIMHFNEEDISMVISKQMVGILLGGALMPPVAGFLYSYFSYNLLLVTIILCMVLLLICMYKMSVLRKS